MAHDPDAGLVKRGFILLGVMALLVLTVLFILFQKPAPAAPDTLRAEHLAWSVAVPGAAYPASVSWAALVELSELVPSPVGWEIRHNAAAALARRGGDNVPWHTFREMLDPQRMAANCREQWQDGQESPELSARALVIAGLRAVAEWHAKRRDAGKLEVPDQLLTVYQIVDRLAESPIPELRDQAQKTQGSFFRG
jgi:hypothetical protein